MQNPAESAACKRTKFSACKDSWPSVSCGDAIKYFHPYLDYREDVDWDKGGVEAIAKVNQAKSPADYADAVEGMLQALRAGKDEVAE